MPHWLSYVANHLLGVTVTTVLAKMGSHVPGRGMRIKNDKKNRDKKEIQKKSRYT